MSDNNLKELQKLKLFSNTLYNSNISLEERKVIEDNTAKGLNLIRETEKDARQHYYQNEQLSGLFKRIQYSRLKKAYRPAISGAEIINEMALKLNQLIFKLDEPTNKDTFSYLSEAFRYVSEDISIYLEEIKRPEMTEDMYNIYFDSVEADKDYFRYLYEEEQERVMDDPDFEVNDGEILDDILDDIESHKPQDFNSLKHTRQRSDDLEI